MVLGSCPFPHCHISIYQVFFKCHKWFKSYLADKVPDGQTDKAATICFHLGEHKKWCIDRSIRRHCFRQPYNLLLGLELYTEFPIVLFETSAGGTCIAFCLLHKIWYYNYIRHTFYNFGLRLQKDLVLQKVLSPCKPSQSILTFQNGKHNDQLLEMYTNNLIFSEKVIINWFWPF